MASYYCFDVEMDAEYQFLTRVTISVHVIVGAVIRDCDLVTKLKIFSWCVCWGFAKIHACKNFPLYGIV